MKNKRRRTELVKLILGMKAHGLTADEIAAELNRVGTKALTKKPWSRHMVHGIVWRYEKHNNGRLPQPRVIETGRPVQLQLAPLPVESVKSPTEAVGGEKRVSVETLNLFLQLSVSPEIKLELINQYLRLMNS